ncbi:MAG TPA: hypothetical protein VFV01_29585 [Spirillospora sp.]|nr:hypothetical protein [Spirillospora sp.]
MHHPLPVRGGESVEDLRRRRNRATAVASAAAVSGSSFTATGRRRRRSAPRHTSPMPPRPSGASSR